MSVKKGSIKRRIKERNNLCEGLRNTKFVSVCFCQKYRDFMSESEEKWQTKFMFTLIRDIERDFVWMDIER